MTILCCGDRNWANREVIARVLAEVKPTKVVQGGARGADYLAYQLAGSMGVECHTVHANWTKHGKAAGPIRNQQMLDLHPDIRLVLAFHNDIANSKGTGDMVRRSSAKGIEVRVITEHD